MGYDWSGLLDPGALAIVLAGTFIATIARCGWSDLKLALRALLRMGTSDFDAGENRMALAPSIAEIMRRGPMCTDIAMPPDASLAKVLIAYSRSGSLEALQNARQSEKAARAALTERRMRAFEYAGELAPVFGLVGTLFAISQLAPLGGDGPADSAMAAIGTAVLSTLYGMLLAHLVCIPIARAIDRKAMREEARREEVIEWLASSLRTAPRAGGRAAASAGGQAPKPATDTRPRVVA